MKTSSVKHWPKYILTLFSTAAMLGLIQPTAALIIFGDADCRRLAALKTIFDCRADNYDPG